jgi:hypothetical protein
MLDLRKQLKRNDQSLREVFSVGRPECIEINFKLEKKYDTELHTFVLHVFLLNIAVYFNVRNNFITCNARVPVVTSLGVWISC